MLNVSEEDISDDWVNEVDASLVTESNEIDNDQLGETSEVTLYERVGDPVNDCDEVRLCDMLMVTSFDWLWLIENSDTVTLREDVADGASFVSDVLDVNSGVPRDNDGD